MIGAALRVLVIWIDVRNLFSALGSVDSALRKLSPRFADCSHIYQALNGKVQLQGPFGYFTLHHNVNRPAVFLAGGIGITPFLSMVRHATRQMLSHLIYQLNVPVLPSAAIAAMETNHAAPIE